MGRNFVAISMAEPLKYLLITLKVVVLEKVSFSNRQIPKTIDYDIACAKQALSAS